MSSPFAARAKPSATRLVQRFGELGTLRRPHTVERTDGVPLVDGAELAVAVAALAGATTLAVNVYSGGQQRARGLIPAETVITIASAGYIVQADASFSSNRATLTISPGLAADVAEQDPVALGDGASWAVRYSSDDLGLREAFAGFEIGSQQITIPLARIPVTPKAGMYFDSSADDDFSGIIKERNRSAGAWELVVS